jgi:hypothetical protein
VVVVQPYARMMYWAKRFVPGLIDLGHRTRLGKRKPPQPVPPGKDADRRAA